MKKITKKNLIFFIMTIVIAIITYWKFIIIHYSTDMYKIINIGYINYAINNSLTDGRIFMAIIEMIGELFKIRPDTYKSILTLLAVVINSISVMKLKGLILKYKQAKNLYIELIVYLIAFCTIFNFIQVEYMYYIESFIISMSILLIIYAADIFINKYKYYYMKTSIICILAVICYQATIPFFIVLIFSLSIIKNKNDYKEIFKDTIKAGIILLISVFVNILIVKITSYILQTKQTRINFNIEVMKENIIYICHNILWIFTNQCNLYIDGLFLTLIIATLLIVFISNRKEKNKHVLNMCLIVLITIIANFAMHIPTISAYYAGRTKFAIGTMLGIIFTYIYIRTKIFDKDNILSNLMMLIIVTYVCSNIIAAIELTTYNKKVNELEKETVLNIEKYIEEYEENNNQEIKNIGIINITDQQEKAFYGQIYNQSVLTQDAVRCDWSVDGVINFYSNKKLKKVELTEDEKIKYLSYFKDESNYVCVENMLLIKAYMY